MKVLYSLREEIYLHITAFKKIKDIRETSYYVLSIDDKYGLLSAYRVSFSQKYHDLPRINLICICAYIRTR